MITTQPEPCWVVVFPNGDAWEEPHFDSEVDAQSDADNRNEADDEQDEAPKYSACQVGHWCVTVACNECGKTVGDDDFDCTHFPDATMVAEMAREADFVVDGQNAWCGDCRRKPHPFLPDPQSLVSCLRCAGIDDEHLEMVGS